MGACGFFSGHPPALARPMPCSRRHARPGPPVRISSSATSNPTGASRPSGCSRASSGCRSWRCATAASRGGSSIWTRRCRRSRLPCLSTSLRTPISPKANPAPRHAKRWQDIEELLEAGIDVWTTLNVQHLESLNDVVAGITGIRQRETIPDRIFDEADEVELIDLPPDDLLARLKAGKVYVAEQVGTATERFFRKPNLLALREIALRRTADRVDAAARDYAGRDRISRPWLASDRFMIAVAPDDQAEQLVRFGKRFADALDAEWLVVTVETPALAETRRTGTQSACRGAAAGGVAGRPDGDPGWSVRCRTLIEYADCARSRGLSSESRAPRLAGSVAAFDGNRTGSPGTGAWTSR